MANNDLFDSLRDNLNGRPGQPMVFGVCQALATRIGQEAWVVRAATLVLGVFFTGFTLVAYILAGLLLDETSERTQGIFRGLFLTLREWVDKLLDGLGDLFKPRNGGTAGRP